MKFLQLSVDSVAHAQRFFKRLKMNVACPNVYREVEKQIYQLDDCPRRTVREVVSLHLDQFVQPIVEVVHDFYFPIPKCFSTVRVMIFMSGS